MREYRLPTEAEMRRHRQLLAEYRQARNAQDEAERIEEASKRQALEAGNYRSTFDGKRIAEPVKDYEMPEDQLPAYYEAVHAIRLRLGASVESAEYTTDYKTHKTLQSAEKALLDWATEMLLDPKVAETLQRGFYHHKWRSKIIETLTALQL